MTRHLIIDGYNLLGTRGGGAGKAGLEGEDKREKLLRDLSSYHQRKGHPVTVVFDGWQQGRGAEHREHRAGIEVIFSRRGQRADQVIQRLAEMYGADCAVVSSDHEVADFARARGAFVIGAKEFEERLHHKAQGKAVIPRMLQPGKETGEPFKGGPEKKGNPRKLPKSVRKRLRQLKSF